MRSQNKYGAVKTTVDNITFDSKLEAKCYLELKLLLRAGEISNLELQKKFEFIVNGKRVGHWTVDFAFINEHGFKIARDAKGVIARDMPLRKKLAESLYPDWTFEYWGKNR